MASIKKFTQSAVPNQLRHLAREIEHSSNPDIDPSRSPDNYSLITDREETPYEYFLKRKSELYCYNRSDVKVMAAWVVTVPEELTREEDQRLFFEKTFDFLQDRYGKENTIDAVVHLDEAGRAHLHYCFIPVVDDAKHGGQKICANDLINRQELINFHPDLQEYLDAAGLDCHVQTGITQEIGGNISVDDLKKAGKYIHTHERGVTW